MRSRRGELGVSAAFSLITSVSLAFVVMAAALASGCARRPSNEPEAAQHEPPAPPRSPLDAELERRWAELDIEASPRSSDAEFLRRASLDLIGRVPTRAEVEAFLADADPDKRAGMIDTLLSSEEFAGHWAGIWVDTLLPSDARVRRIAGNSLEAHLADALAQNRSWAEVVEELLVGEGELAQAASLGYLAGRAARGVPREELVADLGSTTARVFLGARIECAQCHDHPYDPDFTREDFWAQAAFFGRTTFDFQRKGEGPPKVEIAERTRGELRVALGEDEDPRKRPIAPRFMGAEQQAAPDDRRPQLAAAILADPRFAEATVGQVWARLLGRGIVEPWDDLLGRAERPALLTVLAEEFRASDHDLRALIRTIVLSQAYQRSSTGPQTSAKQIAAAEMVFARAAVRPLSSEQLFGSLIVVTGLEQVEGRAFRRAVRQRKEAALREYEFVFSDDEMASADAFSGNVPQALLLLNGGLTHHGVVAREGSSLARLLDASEDTDARLEGLWLTVYGRRPSADELELGRIAIADGQRVSDWEDLMFAMLYSSEFGSNH